MSANILEKARSNRLIALEVLKQREGNLFILEQARKTARRRQENVMFISRRSADLHATDAMMQTA